MHSVVIRSNTVNRFWKEWPWEQWTQAAGLSGSVKACLSKYLLWLFWYVMKTDANFMNENYCLFKLCLHLEVFILLS